MTRLGKASFSNSPGSAPEEIKNKTLLEPNTFQAAPKQERNRNPLYE
jgi:hypothetical protein